MGTPYRIQLEMYEGPLDLLLDLIRKQEIDIHNIPIAKITGQYLEYLNLMKLVIPDVAGEFVVMGATLMYIKSRELLPVDQQAQVEGEEEGAVESHARSIAAAIEAALG